MGIVIGFAGAIGSGRSKVSRAVAEVLAWPRVSFGDHIRRLAQENGENPDDRTVLQRLGQALVMTNVEEFVRSVLSENENWRPSGNLVVDGVRHVEVRWSLLTQVKPSAFKLVYVTVDEPTRRQRAEEEWNIPGPQLIRYDQELTEAQIPRILRAYADLAIDSSLPVTIAAQQVTSRLGVHRTPVVAAP